MLSVIAAAVVASGLAAGHDGRVRLALPILVDGLEPPAEAAPRRAPQPAVDPVGMPIEAVSYDPKVLVIGSFRRFGNARREAERWNAVAASIVSVKVGGIRFYRVVTAPTDPDGIAAQKEILFGGGIRAPWLVPVCAASAAAKDCVRLPGAIRPWWGKAIPPPGG